MRFAERLAADGLGEGDLPGLLALPDMPTTLDRTNPLAQWIPDEMQCVPVEHNVDPENPMSSLNGFTDLLTPHISHAQAQLIRRLGDIQALESVVISPAHMVDLAVSSLTAILFDHVSKVLTLELNVMRLREELAGASGEERFQDFLRQLKTCAFRESLFNEYPVLLRLVEDTTANWVRHWSEVAQRLTADHTDIEQAILGGASLGRLQGVVPTTGDRHRGGRHVTILTFDSGHRLVYKARSLAVDRAYNDVLAWLARAIGDHTLRQPRLLLRETHGWSEFIEHHACESVDGLIRYYDRLGAQLAILHTLEATDMHMENVIASGDTPVVVDLEALFHPRPAMDPKQAAVSPDAGLNAWDAYANSVMRVGLLPNWSHVGEDGEALELSGVGGKGGQWLPAAQPMLTAVGTDMMHMKRIRVRMPAAKNQPVLDGRVASPGLFTEHLVAGFRKAYDCLLANRDRLLPADGLLAAFRRVEVRAVLRNTSLYATLLRDGCHPDLLRDAVDRDIHFEVLWRSCNTRPWLARIVPHELRDLRRGDVPHFRSRPDSTSLWTSDDEEIRDVFASEAYSSMQRRMAALSVSDRDRQCWFIMAALSALDSGTHAAPPRAPVADKTSEASLFVHAIPLTARTTPGVPNENPGTDGDLSARAQQHAMAIVERLRGLALTDGKDANWLGVTLENEKRWVVQPLDDDVYNGRLGVALFLTEAARLESHEQAGELARITLDSCADRLEHAIEYEREYEAAGRLPTPPFAGGAFNAFSGGALVYAHAATVFGERRYARLSDILIERAGQHLYADDQFDIMSGAAGYLLAATALPQFQSASAYHGRLAAASTHLIRHAVPQAAGVAWQTRMDATRPLTGLSHGASGMALALYRTGSLTGSDDCLDTAMKAISYERQCTEEAGGYWPDYRTIAISNDSRRWPSMHAWCHGAPGIGLVRLRLLELAQDKSFTVMLTDDLCLAVNETLNAGFPGNHSLCHGAMGNVLFIDEVWRHAPVMDEPERRHTSVDQLLNSVDRHGPLCGVPRGTETPGLMTGLAGIGLGMLRLAGHEVVDVLTMTLPDVVTS